MPRSGGEREYGKPHPKDESFPSCLPYVPKSLEKRRVNTEHYSNGYYDPPNNTRLHLPGSQNPRKQ